MKAKAQKIRQATSATIGDYASLLTDIKIRIRASQIRAALAANAEMISMYWDIGRMINQRQKKEGWGSAVIPRLAKDIRNDLPEIKGFSERNIGRMIAFYREYQDFTAILPQPAAKLATSLAEVQHLSQLEPLSKVPQPAAKIPCSIFFSIPWFHHIILMEKIKDISTRRWYIEQTISNGWSRETLEVMLRNKSHKRKGMAITNFKDKLPASQSELASQLLKDPYVFDFLTMEEPFHERELETGLISHLEKFLLELGQGFAFVGRQYHMDVSGKDYYIDLLFYHLRLRCFVVIELKRGEFKPEYAGKMNFYCSVVDDRLRHGSDQPTIGLILYQTKDRILAEYSLRDIQKPIGVSNYELTRALPDNLKSSLPAIEDIELELSGRKPQKGKK